ncbi:unnamed protein product [Somion occarium]|uniref:Sphingolipid long chain base-responsive protein LSP1 n=1 Tax=Somion occarium TaxID=3059160 RepID=A0ABP1CI74_9APHY
MSSFFSSIANKAQSALNNTPLAQHIPGSSHGAGTSGESGGSGGSNRYSHTLESIHHQLRTFQQQYSSSTTPAQKIITTQKGVALDLDNVSRDAQANSKEIYLWGQQETDDLKDVTDRIAWLNYVQGQIASALATQLDAARAPFKVLRDAETAIQPRRTLRNNLENQIAKLEHENSKAATQRISEIKTQLHKAQVDDHEAEKEIDILKRKALRESEELRWKALREYGEKLVLLSQAATTILPVLPPIPSSPTIPYTGAETTANVRASLQRALDSYTPGSSNLSFPATSAADLQRSDTRSFGETHRKELDNIGSPDAASQSGIPLTPPATATFPPSGPPPQGFSSQQSPTSSTQSLKAVPVATTGISQAEKASLPASSPPPSNQSPPLNPAKLNQTPAPIPIQTESASATASPDPSDPSTKVPSVLPTVAETGVPKSAGPDGPGPASGSLLDIKSDRTPPTPVYGAAIPTSAVGYETAEEEKKRLEREERERLLRTGGSAPPTSASAGAGDATKYESAEEEKKKLERAERERVLREGGSGGGKGPDNHGPPPPGEGEGELPPYQEF